MPVIETLGVLGSALGAAQAVLGALAQSDDTPDSAKVVAALFTSAMGNIAYDGFKARREAGRLKDVEAESLNHFIEQAYRMAELGSLVQFLHRFARTPQGAADPMGRPEHTIEHLSARYAGVRTDAQAADTHGLRLEHVAAALSSIQQGDWAAAGQHEQSLRREVEARALREIELSSGSRPSPVLAGALRNGLGADLPPWFAMLAHQLVHVLLNQDKREARDSLMLRMVSRVALQADPRALADRIDGALRAFLQVPLGDLAALHERLARSLTALGDGMGSRLDAIGDDMAAVSSRVDGFRVAWQSAHGDLLAQLDGMELRLELIGEQLQRIERRLDARPQGPAAIGPPAARLDPRSLPWARADLGLLPVAGPRLFGRDAEIQAVAAFVAAGAGGVLRVGGRSGAGKSTLVSHALAQAQAAAAQDGGRPLAVVVHRAGARRQAGAALLLAFDRLLASIGLAAVSGSAQFKHFADKAAHVAAELALRGASLVVVLDSLEAVLDPASQRLLDADLDELLARAMDAGCADAPAVIVTCQSVPAVGGTSGTVQPLRRASSAKVTEVDLGSGLGDLAACVAWLRHCDPDGTLGLADAPEALLAALCESVGRNPNAVRHLAQALALEPGLTPGSLLEALADPSRQRRPELQAVDQVLIARSHAGLPAAQQQALQAIAVSGGSATAGVVAALLDGAAASNARAVLRGLLDRRLVRQQGEACAIHDSERAWILAHLPADGARSRRVLAARAAAHWDGLGTEPARWDDFAQAHAALQAIALWADAGAADEAAPRRLRAARRLFDIGHLEAATQLLLQAAEGEQTGVREVERQALLATCRWKKGDHAQASAHAARGLSLLEDGGPRHDALHRRLRHLAASCALETGHVQEAIASFDAIVRELRAQPAGAEDRLLLAQLSIELGFAHSMAGQIGQAIECGTAALQACDDVQPAAAGRRLKAMATAYLATHHSYSGATEPALGLYLQAVLDGQQLGARYELATSLGLFAEFELLHGTPARAESFARRALAIEADTDAINGSWCHYLIALACGAGPADEARLALAETHARQACGFSRPLNDPNPLALLGMVQLRRGAHDTAAQTLLRALAAADRLVDRCSTNWEAWIARGWSLLGLAHLGLAPRAQALEAYRRAHAASPRLGHLARIEWHLRCTPPVPGPDGRPAVEDVRALYAGSAPAGDAGP